MRKFIFRGKIVAINRKRAKTVIIIFIVEVINSYELITKKYNTTKNYATSLFTTRHEL